MVMHRFDRETLEAADTDLVVCQEEATRIAETSSPFVRAERLGRLEARLEAARAGIALALRMSRAA